MTVKVHPLHSGVLRLLLPNWSKWYKANSNQDRWGPGAEKMAGENNKKSHSWRHTDHRSSRGDVEMLGGARCTRHRGTMLLVAFYKLRILLTIIWDRDGRDSREFPITRCPPQRPRSPNYSAREVTWNSARHTGLPNMARRKITPLRHTLTSHFLLLYISFFSCSYLLFIIPYLPLPIICYAYSTPYGRCTN